MDVDVNVNVNGDGDVNVSDPSDRQDEHCAVAERASGRRHGFGALPASAVSWVRFSWLTTALFGITAVGAVWGPDALEILALVVALGLFGVGAILFMWAFFLSADRSRLEEVAVVEVYFLAGKVAPGVVKLHFFGALMAQIVIGVTTASIRPFTSLAFGILVPVLGLGVTGRWSAEHADYRTRTVLRTKRKATGKGSASA